jgi:hypothetical protein
MKRAVLVFLIGSLCPLVARAKQPLYRTGLIVSMNSVPCGSEGKRHKKTLELLCQEYVVRTDTLEYHIRQQNQGHADLLPIGEQAEFRLVKDIMRLHVSEPDGKIGKEHNYLVTSILRRSGGAPDASPQ